MMTTTIKLTSQEKIIWDKINSETAKIQWLHLQRFFAAGKLIVVGQPLDLIDTAFYCQQDNFTIIKTYQQNKWFLPVSDAQAKAWHKNNDFLWAVVVNPFILIQLIA